MARAIRAGLVKLPQSGIAVPPPAGLNCKPHPCALPNVLASPGGSQPVDEDPISVDPNNNKHIVSAGNDYNCGSSLRGFFASTDGGKTWVVKCGPVASGATGGDGDPAVAWDLNGNVFSAGIDALPSGDTQISVSKSTDHGNTWGTPVAAAKVSGIFMDKEWLEADTTPTSPHANSLYLSITQFVGNNSQIGVSHSSDGGATWTLKNVDSQQIYPTFVDQFSDLAIGADGTVYVSWLRCPANGPTGDCGGTTSAMYMSKSTDGGNTWSKEVKIQSVALAPDSCGAFYGCLPNTFERVSNIPVIAIDNAATSANFGTLYVVDYNWTGTYMKAQVTSSTDGGATWSKAVGMAPDGNTHDQFFPWINVSSTGLIGATWLDRSLDPANVNYCAFGATGKKVKQLGGANLQICDVQSNPFDDGFGSGFMGDYDVNAWDPVKKKLYYSWTDTRNGSTSQNEVGGLRP
ncbi:MAG TPA: sialidase family protein [Rhizomicrobium sp.]|nr:sialidase family protein [Rhizomicrobium sp.]